MHSPSSVPAIGKTAKSGRHADAHPDLANRLDDGRPSDRKLEMPGAPARAPARFQPCPTSTASWRCVGTISWDW